MYNGIGLTTARGTGTNGYVQANLSNLLFSKNRTDYNTEADIEKAEAEVNRKPNVELLDHEYKRTMEIKCIEFEDLMEGKGFTEEEIQAKVNEYRKLLYNEFESGKNKDMDNELDLRNSHSRAKVAKDNRDRFRSALGIDASFVDGTSLEKIKKASEMVKAAAKEEGAGEQMSAEKEMEKNLMEKLMNKMKKKSAKKGNQDSSSDSSSSTSSSDSSDSDSSDNSSTSSSSSSCSSKEEERRKMKKRKDKEKSSKSKLSSHKGKVPKEEPASPPARRRAEESRKDSGHRHADRSLPPKRSGRDQEGSSRRRHKDQSRERDSHRDKRRREDDEDDRHHSSTFRRH